MIMSMWDKTIDKSIPTPLYFQVEKIIRDGILTGELSTGDMIPTENELMDQYNVSRATIRHAILNLVNDQLLRREKSKGTFVTQPPERLHIFESLSWFSKYLEKTGIPYSTKILEQAVITPDRSVSDHLNLKPDELVYYVRRIRYLNETPYLLDEHFVPYRLCHGIENIYNDDRSLYDTLRSDFGINLDHGWREFEPAIPTREVTDVLEIYPKTPVLIVRSCIKDPNELPVDYFIATIHGRFYVDISLL
jgi:GntR family transcriptional regulator